MGRSSWNSCRVRCNARLNGWLAEQQPGRGSCDIPFFRENRECDRQIEIRPQPPPQYPISLISYLFRCPGVTDAGISLRRGLFDGSMSESTWGNFTKGG